MEKTKKAYEVVIESIKEQIMNQELVLGQSLPPEREISEKLGVSRNSVREALKILTVMGVVSSRQGAGNYISGNFKGYMVDALSMMSFVSAFFTASAYARISSPIRIWLIWS